jgi:hypothetical protein
VFHNGYAFGETVTEYACHPVLRDGLKLLTEQEGIAERRCVRSRASTRQSVRDLSAIAIDCVEAPRRA